VLFRSGGGGGGAGGGAFFGNGTFIGYMGRPISDQGKNILYRLYTVGR